MGEEALQKAENAGNRVCTSLGLTVDGQCVGYAPVQCYYGNTIYYTPKLVNRISAINSCWDQTREQRFRVISKSNVLGPHFFRTFSLLRLG